VVAAHYLEEARLVCREGDVYRSAPVEFYYVWGIDFNVDFVEVTIYSEDP